MILIPAIDLKDGQAVRLKQGDMDQSTVFGDPVEMARRWVSAGARRLHLVDLNGAFAGKPQNLAAVKAILAEVGSDIPVQLGGGIRDLDTIERYLDAGLSYVIIGTAAIKNPGFLQDACTAFSGHIIVGLDAKDGKVATDGWSKLTGHDVADLAKKYEDYGVESIIYTDIGRDGMLSGINIEATVKLAQSADIPVIASGGLSNMQDIEKLCAVESEGIEGVICGRAIYSGDLDFAAAQKEPMRSAHELSSGAHATDAWFSQSTGGKIPALLQWSIYLTNAMQLFQWADLKRSAQLNLRLGVALSFVAGAANAGGFLAFGQYTSHMSGMVSAIADNLVLGQLALVMASLGSILAFLLGAMTTAWLVNWAHRRRLHSAYGLPLLFEAIMLLVFGLFGAAIGHVSVIFLPLTIVHLCYLMGLQNAVITKISHAEIRTTHVTGLLTDMGIELGKLLYINRLPHEPRVLANRQRLRMHTLLITGFLVGGLFGALGFRFWGYITTIPLASLLMLFALPPIWADIKHHSWRSTSRGL